MAEQKKHFETKAKHMRKAFETRAADAEIVRERRQ